MREQSLHVDLPGSADEGVEGPQQEWLGGPGSNRDPLHVQSSVVDPDPGSGIGCFLTPVSGIRNRFFPDPRSRIPRPYF